MIIRAFYCCALMALCAICAAALETVRFNTGDGCALEGFYQSASSAPYVFVNVHGLGSDKNEWAGFGAALKKKGYGYLSIDLRGHGRSLTCSGKPAGYRAFSPSVWRSLSGDIFAAAAFLKSRGVRQDALILCGASIGANLSVRAVMEGLRPAGLALLSPGLVYAGVGIEEFFRTDAGVPVFAAASPDDEYSWRSAAYLAGLAGTGGVAFTSYTGAGGHGANMFDSGKAGVAPNNSGGTTDKKPDLAKAIFSWVKRLK